MCEILGLQALLSRALLSCAGGSGPFNLLGGSEQNIVIIAAGRLELPACEQAKWRGGWGVFGQGDELGFPCRMLGTAGQRDPCGQ